jgi:hypothetical protein
MGPYGQTMTSTSNTPKPDAPVYPTARELYLAGTGSFAVEVAEWAQDAGQAVVGLIELRIPHAWARRSRVVLC